jgi:hypothetical protein
MIVFDLACGNGHTFEGWFGSSGDFAAQKERGLVTCPVCSSVSVDKAPMAPAVGRKGNRGSVAPATGSNQRQVANGPLPPEVAQALSKLADAQAKALKDSRWVGKQFAEQSRAMHYGEREHEAIHGQASMAEARDLIDEGVPVAPLPLPVAPPDELN